MTLLDILMVIIRVAFALFVPLTFVSIFVWMERRGASLIQDRSGPNRAAIKGFTMAGLFHPIADAVKLAFKEDLVPGHVEHKYYFTVAPAIVFVTAVLTFGVVPFADNLTIFGKSYMMQGLPMDTGILWFLGIAGFAVYGIIIAGWSSHNKYGTLGALRASAQVISYEIPMGLSLVSLLMVYGSIDLNEMARFQGGLLFGFIPKWGIIIQPLAAMIFIVTAFAEANRTPFDLAEGESEIVAGYHTEYSAMKFAMFFMGEYVAMFVSSAIIVTLFFGGYQIPWLPTETMVAHSTSVVIGLMVLIFAGTFALTSWVKKNNRFKYKRENDKKVLESKIISAGFWGICLLIETALLAHLVYGFGENSDRILIAVIQTAVFIFKTTLMGFVYVWVRWTLPRFRFDQLQKLAWAFLLPLSLFNIFITAAWLVYL